MHGIASGLLFSGRSTSPGKGKPFLEQVLSNTNPSGILPLDRETLERLVREKKSGWKKTAEGDTYEFGSGANHYKVTPAKEPHTRAISPKRHPAPNPFSVEALRANPLMEEKADPDNYIFQSQGGSTFIIPKESTVKKANEYISQTVRKTRLHNATSRKTTMLALYGEQD